MADRDVKIGFIKERYLRIHVSYYNHLVRGKSSILFSIEQRVLSNLRIGFGIFKKTFSKTIITEKERERERKREREREKKKREIKRY